MISLFKGNRNLLIIALIALVNALGYGIIIPITYSYSQRFGLDAFQNGLLFALFSLGQFISTPIIGRLSDKYGRRPLLIVSIAGTALSFFMLAFAPNAIVLYLARLLDGITAGNIPVASAVISDTTEPKDRAKGFGIITASFNFGFIFGPAIAGLTVGFSPAMPFLIAGVITTIATILTFLYLPETNKHLGEVRQGKLFDFVAMAKAAFDKSVGNTLLITLLFSIAFGMFIVAFQTFSKDVLKLEDNAISGIYTLFGIVGLGTQMMLIPFYIKQFGERRAFNIVMGAAALGFFFYFLSRNVVLFIGTSIFLALFMGAIMPITQAILSRETDSKSQGSIMGINASYMSIGTILGPIIGGYLLAVDVPLAFLGGSLLLFICFLLSFTVLAPHTKKDSAF